MNKPITIGGSEIAAVMGQSRWCSPLRLWAEKTGKIEREDISGNEWIELGTELEDFVARRFSKITGLTVRRDRKAYRHKIHEYMIGHIDRNIVGTDAILECKTASAYKLKEWEGEEIPIEYVLQLNWYLGLTESKIGYIAVLIGGQKFLQKQIEFDKGLFDQQVMAAFNFVEHNCKHDIPPVAISLDNDFIKDLYPQNRQPMIVDVDDDTINLINQIQTIKSVIKSDEKRQEDLEAKLKQIIGESEGIITADFKVTWLNQISKRLNTEAIKKAGLYDQYAVETESRVLRIAKNKK